MACSRRPKMSEGVSVKNNGRHRRLGRAAGVAGQDDSRLVVAVASVRPARRRMAVAVAGPSRRTDGWKVIHTDDTVLPVQDKSRDRPRQGRIWVYVGDRAHPYTVFDFTPNHTRDGPQRFLGKFAGFLQADAFAGYDAIYLGSRGKIVEV